MSSCGPVSPRMHTTPSSTAPRLRRVDSPPELPRSGYRAVGRAAGEPPLRAGIAMTRR
jgi:hypothetical protein